MNTRYEIFKEMLTHARHQERQRHAFLVVFISIFVAVFSFFLKSDKTITDNTFLLCLLWFITFLGYGLTIKWNIAYYKYKHIAYIVLRDIKRKYSDYFHKSNMKIPRAGTMYIFFYVAILNMIIFYCLSSLNLFLTIILCLGLCYLLMKLYLDIRDYSKKKY